MLDGRLNWLRLASMTNGIGATLMAGLIKKYRDSTRSGNEPSPGLPMPQQRSRRKSNRAVLDKSASNRVNDSKNYLTTPSKHDDHICEDVNYDNISSLEGGTGSFNLGEPEPSVVLYEPTKVSIGREDLLKSFIISEVMQRYDINRIYSRIPSVKSDD